MIFHEMEIENFRQFHGNQVLLFSHDKTKNVSVVHGENGSGKTTILNAFIWCFYNVVDFENPKNIINERLIDEASIGEELIIRVKIVFENDNSRYIFERTGYAEKVDAKNTRTSKDDKVTCIEIGADGVSREKRNPEDMINQILPKRMYPYFFFNGERIDNLSKNESSQEIVEAIKNIMGLEIIERAIMHLSGSVKKELKKDLQQFGNIEVNEKLKQLEKAEDSKKTVVEEIQLTKKNEKGFLQEKEDVRNKLKKLEETKAYQEKRDLLEENRKIKEKEIQNTKDELRKLINKWGFTTFAKKLVDNCEIIIEDKRAKGEIPAGIKRQFVEDLLNRGFCICKRNLDHGTDAHEYVKSWLNKGGTDEIDEAFSEIGGTIKLIKIKIEETWIEITKQVTIREALNNDIKIIDEELSEIRRKLNGRMTEQVTDLERKYKKLESKIEDCRFNLGDKNHHLKEIQDKIGVLEKQIREMKKEERKLQIAGKRLDICYELTDAFKKIMNLASKLIKDEVSNKVNDIFRSIVKKDYWAEITDDYELRIYKKVGDSKMPVGKSTGENQVSSLSFIGGLADIARKHYHHKIRHFFRGGIYPLIMDSPFGQLDPDYRRLVAQRIPKLAPQIIVMASESQWKGEVKAGMQPYIGKESHLCIYTPFPDRKGIENRKFLKKSNKYEYVKIREMGDEYQTN